jgi:predicted homoserine dehydrogenase-like protein
MARDVKKDSVLTHADVVVPEGRMIDALQGRTGRARGDTTSVA